MLPLVERIGKMIYEITVENNFAASSWHELPNEEKSVFVEYAQHIINDIFMECALKGHI